MAAGGPPEAVPALAVQTLRRPLGALSAALWLLDAQAGADGTRTLRLAAQDGLPPDALSTAAVLHPAADHPARRVVDEDGAQPVQGAPERASQSNGTPTLSPILAVPLRAAGRILGAMMLVWPDEQALSPARRAIVATVAALTAQALANAHAAAVAQEDHRRLVTTFDSMVDAVFLYDRAGWVIDLNEAALHLLGLRSRAEAVGPQVDHLRNVELCRPDGRAFDKRTRPSLRAVHGEPVVGFEEIVRHLDSGEERRVLINAAPVWSDDGVVSGAVLVCHDVTALRAAERVKDEFVSVASHELKTPLTPLKGFVQIVDTMLARAEQGGSLDYARAHRYMGVMRARVDRLVELVATMLDLSRLQAGPFTLELASVDLVHLAAETLSEFEAELAATDPPLHRLLLDAAGPVEAHCDAQRIEQVVMNLIANALKYSPRGGTIRVTVSKDDGNAVLQVDDDGIGIPPGEEARLFQPFTRGSNAPALQYAGVGLGLYICREIVERHGGRVAVLRDPAEAHMGTKIHVTLPLAGPAPEHDDK